MIPSSEELFRHVCNGNHTSFNELYNRYSPKILAYAKTVLKDSHQALDIVQQVFTSVYASRSTFNGGNFDAWIFSIARHACARQKKLNARNIELENAHEIPATETGLSDSDVETIRHTVNRLPEEDQLIIKLRYFDDLAYEDIAAALDISLSATKVRLFRARKKLAHILKPHFKDE